MLNQLMSYMKHLLATAQVFLVGDPVQLPATVISGRADKHGYSTSLFKRLQSSGFPVQVGQLAPTLFDCALGQTSDLLLPLRDDLLMQDSLS